MADTPRFLLLSRRGLRPPTGEVEEKLEDWTGDKVTERWSDGARYGGGNSVRASPLRRLAMRGACIVVVLVSPGNGMVEGRWSFFSLRYGPRD